jgi:hypothetical protein
MFSKQGKIMVQPVPIRPTIELLDFDPENPRFFDSASDAPSSDEKSIVRMMEEENLDELVGSIGNQGFFPGEPLLVAPNRQLPGRYIVVEGNRRLAALRALRGLIPRANLTQTIADAVENAEFKPTEVECFLFPQRRDILKYLGFRHISGPRRWEPLSKARYLADLIRNFYHTLPQEDQLISVARDIGSRRSYVAQLLTALNLYDRAKAARFYGLQRVGEEDISFSLLSTALSYSNIVTFLNLPSRDAISVDAVNDDHAKELLSWMFAQDQRGDTVLGESRRLKILAAVVASPRAVIELRSNNNLDQAYVFTSGPTETFTKLLAGIESSIADSIGLLGGDVELNAGHITQIDRIVGNAENLQLLIQKAVKNREKRLRLVGTEGLQDV